MAYLFPRQCDSILSMSSLDSQSTNAEVWSSYDDSASYEEDQSIGKCRAFITAANILLRRRPSLSTVDGNTQAFDPKPIQDALKVARAWIAANDTRRSSRPSAVSWDTSRVRG